MKHAFLLYVASAALIAIPTGCTKTPPPPASAALPAPKPETVVAQPDPPAILPPKIDPVIAIHPGDTLASVRAALGTPNGQMQLGTKLVLSYDRGQVQLVDGKVISTNFLSTEDFAAQQAQAAQLRAQNMAKGKALKAQVLAEPAFIYAPVAYQLSFWQNFRLLYPEVSCDDEYNRAQQQLALEQQQIAAAQETAAAQQTAANQPYYGGYYPRSFYYRSWPYYRYTTYYREHEREFNDHDDRDHHDSRDHQEIHDHHTPWVNTPVYSPSYNRISPAQSYTAAVNNAVSAAHGMPTARMSTPSDSYTAAVNSAMSTAHGMPSTGIPTVQSLNLPTANTTPFPPH